jgi:hypothetical protein
LASGSWRRVRRRTRGSRRRSSRWRGECCTYLSGAERCHRRRRAGVRARRCGVGGVEIDTPARHVEPELTGRDIKTRLIDSQPQAEAPTTLGADRRSGVDVNKQSQSSSGGCC